MKYLSVCSGIEACTVAWEPLGWEPWAFSQFDPEHKYKHGPDFPSAVLAHHWPDVPNLGDMTKFKEWPDADFDVLVGGTPCQSFSVAGLRRGLADPRGNLMLTYLAIARRYQPKWLVWENVPGVLSSGEGRDFGTFLGALGELGYGFAYRVLDAIHFGTPMRNRRVFVIGYFGDWRRAAAVLFERTSVTDVRKTVSGVPRIDASGLARSQTMPERGRCWTVHDGRGHRFLTPGECELLMGFPYGYTAIPHCRKQSTNKTAVEPEDPLRNDPGTVRRNDSRAERQMCSVRQRDEPSRGGPRSPDRGGAGHSVPPLQRQASSGRRRGLGSTGTSISGRRKITPDGPRYRALGNSMAVPVVRWIGERIDMVEEHTDKEATT